MSPGYANVKLVLDPLTMAGRVSLHGHWTVSYEEQGLVTCLTVHEPVTVVFGQNYMHALHWVLDSVAQ